MKSKLQGLEEKQAEAKLRKTKSLVSVTEENGEEGEACSAMETQGNGDLSTGRSIAGLGEKERQAREMLSDDGRMWRQEMEGSIHGRHESGSSNALQDLSANNDSASLPSKLTQNQEQGLDISQVEPERLPRAEPEPDGGFLLKGLHHFHVSANRDQQAKLESFDRKLGRKPNAINEVGVKSKAVT